MAVKNDSGRHVNCVYVCGGRRYFTFEKLMLAKKCVGRNFFFQGVDLVYKYTECWQQPCLCGVWDVYNNQEPIEREIELLHAREWKYKKGEGFLLQKVEFPPLHRPGDGDDDDDGIFPFSLHIFRQHVVCIASKQAYMFTNFHSSSFHLPCVVMSTVVTLSFFDIINF